MALLATCSKKTLLVPLTVLLLMALLATAVPAGHDAAGHQDLHGCAEVKGCTEKLCGGMCGAIGSNGVGSCRIEAQSSYCCCHPKPSSDIGVHQLV
ncbi:hypothetical protein GQ55_8G063900 [Panicum hallii var. hallii]|uniref:Knottin scorpion toxin-like domain-containing protein n=1 Tax=Panicum hallii var. hallii TaxID=1504633 RepID=A0A2T7CLA9_9POAL|nr:hypothetical protein GQ55_8G063900 [Panicum hallii var. hallii]